MPLGYVHLLQLLLFLCTSIAELQKVTPGPIVEHPDLDCLLSSAARWQRSQATSRIQRFFQSNNPHTRNLTQPQSKVVLALAAVLTLIGECCIT